MLQCQLLNPIRFPLIERFYKAHYPKGKPKKDDIIWVLEKQQQIIGVARFKQFDENQLLTGLAIAKDEREQGLGKFFLQALHPQIAQKPCFGFAYSHLEAFYASVGFSKINQENLPDSLKTLFNTYVNTNKNLISMQCAKK